MLDNARMIVGATVSANLQDGFGDDPVDCAATITLASQVGLVAGSIEDASWNLEQPIYDIQVAVERI